MPNVTNYRIREPAAADHDRWYDLYTQYLTFYKVPVTDEVRDTVWSWVTDPEHNLECGLIENESGAIAGLFHYREYPVALLGTTAGFLDDLIVEPAFRGTGAVEVALNWLKEEATRRGWVNVAWLTADDNFRARSVYDRFATRTMWLTYEMDPASGDQATTA